MNKLTYAIIGAVLSLNMAYADNQTLTTSTILPQNALPFTVRIEEMNLVLPVGLHSGASANFQGKWLIVAGRLNGLHGFGGDPFPPDEQNASFFVIDLAKGVVYSRELKDSSSGLSRQQIDSLSVTSPQSYQDGETLYMTGGYVFDATTGLYTTKPILTALNIPGVIRWVMGAKNSSVSKNMKQLVNPVFQVTGGKMYKFGRYTRLVFGQKFEGVYTPASNGDYTEQMRQFEIVNHNGKLDIIKYSETRKDPAFRRRDLNIVPAILTINSKLQEAFIAYSGVFTLTGGIWTVPVIIGENGIPTMADPAALTTFKQGMNNYASPVASMYSRRGNDMYNIFFGGLSYGYYSGGVFTTDAEIPFINQVTTVKIDNGGRFTQYIMNNEYPVILSTQSNPGNQLLFGAGAYYFPAMLQRYPNNVINLDNIKQPTVIGYIVGGIMSTLPNTNTDADSAASPYIFKVILTPK